MHISVFDTNSLNRIRWSNACKSDSIQLKFFDNITEQITDAGMLVVDESVVGIVDNSLLGRLFPNHYVIYSCRQIAINQALEMVRHGVKWIYTQAESDIFFTKSVPILLDDAKRFIHRRDEYRRLSKAISTFDDLDREIWQRIVRGETNREIGSAAHISTRTVESRRAKIYKKLGSECIALALRDYFQYEQGKREFEVPEAIRLQIENARRFLIR